MIQLSPILFLVRTIFSKIIRPNILFYKCFRDRIWQSFRPGKISSPPAYFLDEFYSHQFLYIINIATAPNIIRLKSCMLRAISLLTLKPVKESTIAIKISPPIITKKHSRNFFILTLTLSRIRRKYYLSTI